MLEQIIKQSTDVGDFVLDLFGGSGVTLDAALHLKRKCHICDIADDAINRMLKIVDKYKSNVKTAAKTIFSNTYDEKQLECFATGKLF